MPPTLQRALHLNQAISSYQLSALGSRTRSSYNTGLRAWLRFTALFDIAGPSPAYPDISEEILIYFVSHCAHTLQLSYKTIKVYLAGVRNHYVQAGLPNPLLSTSGQPLLRLQHVICGIRCTHAYRSYFLCFKICAISCVTHCLDRTRTYFWNLRSFSRSLGFYAAASSLP